MIPGAIDKEAARAWTSFFEVLQAGGRCAHAFGMAALELPAPVKALLGLDGADEPYTPVQRPEPAPAPAVVSNIRERFPIGTTLSAFGKQGKVVGYHDNGTYIFVDLGGPSPASFDPDNPPG